MDKTTKQLKKYKKMANRAKAECSRLEEEIRELKENPTDIEFRDIVSVFMHRYVARNQPNPEAQGIVNEIWKYL